MTQHLQPQCVHVGGSNSSCQVMCQARHAAIESATKSLLSSVNSVTKIISQFLFFFINSQVPQFLSGFFKLPMKLLINLLQRDFDDLISFIASSYFHECVCVVSVFKAG